MKAAKPRYTWANYIWVLLFVLMLARAIFPDFFHGLSDGLFDDYTGR